MFLIVGLGNPGKEYENTRHNVGFMALDALKKLELHNAILVKPQAFMNDSGKAVKSFLTKYKILNTKYLVVVHDDIDIPLGEIKISQNRGSAGHKGVQSIIQTLGTKDFTRIRIGIQPKSGKPKNVENFVLQKFKKTELPLLQSAIEEVKEKLDELVVHRAWESEDRGPHR